MLKVTQSPWAQLFQLLPEAPCLTRAHGAGQGATGTLLPAPCPSPNLFPKSPLFFFKLILFIYLFLAVLGLRLCARAFSSCGKWGPLFITVRRPLTIAAFLVAEHRLQTHRLSSCGSWAQLLRGMWDLPRPGLEPASPALAGRFSPTAPPGSPRISSLMFPFLHWDKHAIRHLFNEFVEHTETCLGVWAQLGHRGFLWNRNRISYAHLCLLSKSLLKHDF